MWERKISGDCQSYILHRATYDPKVHTNLSHTYQNSTSICTMAPVSGNHYDSASPQAAATLLGNRGNDAPANDKSTTTSISCNNTSIINPHFESKITRILCFHSTASNSSIFDHEIRKSFLGRDCFVEVQGLQDGVNSADVNASTNVDGNFDPDHSTSPTYFRTLLQYAQRTRELFPGEKDSIFRDKVVVSYYRRRRNDERERGMAFTSVENKGSDSGNNNDTTSNLNSENTSPEDYTRLYEFVFLEAAWKFTESDFTRIRVRYPGVDHIVRLHKGSSSTDSTTDSVPDSEPPGTGLLNDASGNANQRAWYDYDVPGKKVYRMKISLAYVQKFIESEKKVYESEGEKAAAGVKPGSDVSGLKFNEYGGRNYTKLIGFSNGGYFAHYIMLLKAERERQRRVRKQLNGAVKSTDLNSFTHFPPLERLESSLQTPFALTANQFPFVDSFHSAFLCCCSALFCEPTMLDHIFSGWGEHMQEKVKMYPLNARGLNGGKGVVGLNDGKDPDGSSASANNENVKPEFCMPDGTLVAPEETEGLQKELRKFTNSNGSHRNDRTIVPAAELFDLFKNHEIGVPFSLGDEGCVTPIGTVLPMEIQGSAIQEIQEHATEPEHATNPPPASPKPTSESPKGAKPSTLLLCQADDPVVGPVWVPSALISLHGCNLLTEKYGGHCVKSRLGSKINVLAAREFFGEW